MGLNTTTQDAILNFVMGAMFILLPLFWVAALAWSGVQTGNILNGLTKGTEGVQQAGRAAGGMAEGAIKSTANKS